MSQYKCVPGPKNLIVHKVDDMAKAVVQFSEIINSNCVDGWDFYALEEVAVTNKPGCLAGLFGAKESTVMYNMLIFKKG